MTVDRLHRHFIRGRSQSALARSSWLSRWQRGLLGAQRCQGSFAIGIRRWHDSLDLGGIVKAYSLAA